MKPINRLKRALKRAAARPAPMAAAAGFLLLAGPIASEMISLSTTYPSPVGIYARIITTGGSTGAVVHTLLARDKGNVGVGMANPQMKLSVNGGVQVADQTIVADNTCTSSPNTAGSIRYNSVSHAMEFCDGSGWRSFTGGGGLKTYAGMTTSAYSGAQVGGYTGGDAKCAAQFGTGTRMCTSSDFINGTPPASPWTRYNSFTLAGGGGVWSTDCSGWTSNGGYGELWTGSPNVDYCGTAYSIACCK